MLLNFPIFSPLPTLLDSCVPPLKYRGKPDSSLYFVNELVDYISTEYCNADRTTWKLTLQDINTTPKELKTERDCSHRQLFRLLWGSSVWRNNHENHEKISAHSDVSSDPELLTPTESRHTKRFPPAFNQRKSLKSQWIGKITTQQTKTSKVNTVSCILLNIRASIYRFESFTWIPIPRVPIQILYIHGHFKLSNMKLHMLMIKLTHWAWAACAWTNANLTWSSIKKKRLLVNCIQKVGDNIHSSVTVTVTQWLRCVLFITDKRNMIRSTLDAASSKWFNLYLKLFSEFSNFIANFLCEKK